MHLSLTFMYLRLHRLNADRRSRSKVRSIQAIHRRWHPTAGIDAILQKAHICRGRWKRWGPFDSLGHCHTGCYPSNNRYSTYTTKDGPLQFYSKCSPFSCNKQFINLCRWYIFERKCLLLNWSKDRNIQSDITQTKGFQSWTELFPWSAMNPYGIIQLYNFNIWAS